MRDIRIAVCGCGMGGMAAAILLSRAGHDVTLFERFETPRPVGSGFMLQSVGLAVLERLGLRAAIEARGARIARLFGRSGAEGPVVLDVRYAAMRDVYGVAVQRAALFDLLYERVQAEGVALRTGHTVTGIEGAHLRFDAGETEGPFDLVIDALGMASPLSRDVSGLDLPYGALWATLDWPRQSGFATDALEQRYHKACRMAGVLPVGRLRDGATEKTTFFWSLHRDAVAEWRTTPLADWKQEVRALWPETEVFLDQITAHDVLTFARYRHRTLNRPDRGRLIHIGDSYHAASPQLGQGANMALLDAWALAQAVTEAREPGEIGPGFRRQRHLHVMLYQVMSWLFTPVYQSDSSVLPFVRDRIAGPISRIPPAPHLLARMVSGQLGPAMGLLGLRDPG